MSEKKCVPKDIHLLCNKCPKSSPFTIINPTTTIHGKDLGTEKDKVFGSNFQSFGPCSANNGLACVPTVTEWKKISPKSLTCSGNRLLTHKSTLKCTTGTGGEISIILKPPTPEIPNAFQRMRNKMNGMVNKVTAPLNEAKKAVGDTLSSAKESLGNAIGGAVDTVKEAATDAHIAIGDKIGAVVKGVKDGADNIENFAEEHFEAGNEARFVLDLYKGQGNILLGALEGSAALVTGAKDLVVGTGSHLYGYATDFTGAASKDIDTIAGVGNAVYRRTNINKLLNPEDYAEARASDINKLKAIGQGTKEWYNNLTPSDIQRLIGRGGFEAAFAILTGGSTQIASITQKVNVVKNSIKSTDNVLETGSNATNAAKIAKKNEGEVIINTPDELPEGKKGDKSDSDSTKNDGENDQGSTCAGPPGVCKNDPVEIISGAMFYPGEDFEIPGIIPLKWERTWYSDSKYNGVLGYGFHHSYDVHLEERTNDLLLWLPSGQSAFFPKLTKEKTTDYNRIEKLTLSKLENENYSVFNHKTQLHYELEEKESGTYRLIKISNSDLVSIHFEYQNNTLSKIIDTANRVINITSNENHKILKIDIHHKGQKRELVSYAYNDSNDLIEITDPIGKSTKMRYKNHLMVSKTDRNGQTFYWEYDGLKTGAKCIHTWGDGGIFEGFMEYHKEYTIYSNETHGQSYYYHKNGLCTKEIDALGGEVIKEYNEYNELVKSIDEEGNETLFDYDDKGNLIAVQYPDKVTDSFVYDKKGRLQIAAKPEGGTSVYSYKEERLDTIIQANGMMSTFEYNKNGTISKVYDNLDNETELFYDEDYNLVKLISPNKNISLWEYNEWSQCIKAINSQNHSQEFSYDSNGRVTKILLPDENTLQLKYNAYDEIIESIDKDRTVKFEYTPLGSLKTRIENNTKVNFQYNSQEELMGIINEHGESYRFTRDLKGNIIKEKGFDGLSRDFYRDRAGKVLKIDRPDNKHSIYEYNKGGRISRIEHHDGTWTTYTYNKDGLLTEAVNSNSHIKFTRDEAGRVVSENQDGYVVNSQYGEQGIRTNINSSIGAAINFEHSILGEVTQMIAKTKDSKPWEANFLYNSLGMETERVLPGGVINSWDYDITGLPKQHIVKNNGREQRNRVYSWDVNSKLKRITNNLTNKATGFTYDAFNSLAAAQYEDGSYDYKLPDEVGNLYRTENKNDQEYGKSGKLLRSGATTYYYDEEGNLIKKDAPEGLWHYQWEAGGMLQSVLKPNKTNINFEYDALGRRTAKIVQSSKLAENNITRWVWDGNVPLHEWQYNLKDRPKTVINEVGKVTKEKKEPLENLITWVFEQGSFKPTAKITKDETYSIITDYLGTPVEMYNSQGKKTWEVEYDIYGKLRKLVKGVARDCPFRYQGQYEDMETGLYYNRFRYYSANQGIYLSKDPIGLQGKNPNVYAYTPDVNTILDPFGLKCKHFASNPKEAHAIIQDKWGETMNGDDMRELQNTIDRVKLNDNSAFPHKDGTPFENSHIKGPDSQRLDTNSVYEEWTVKSPNLGNKRGRRRVVVDRANNRAYYSHDHYDLFIEIDLSGW